METMVVPLKIKYVLLKTHIGSPVYIIIQNILVHLTEWQSVEY